MVVGAEGDDERWMGASAEFERDHGTACELSAEDGEDDKMVLPLGR